MFSTSQTFHPLPPTVAPPPRMNNPFYYRPHPLCREAMAEVAAWIGSNDAFRREADKGKMIGVMVVADGSCQLGYLAAYSGQLDGRGDWPGFVPMIFDYLKPDGYFLRQEAAIEALGRDIEAERQRIGDQLVRLNQVEAAERADIEADIDRFPRPDGGEQAAARGATARRRGLRGGAHPREPVSESRAAAQASAAPAHGEGDPGRATATVRRLAGDGRGAQAAERQPATVAVLPFRGGQRHGRAPLTHAGLRHGAPVGERRVLRAEAPPVCLQPRSAPSLHGHDVVGRESARRGAPPRQLLPPPATPSASRSWPTCCRAWTWTPTSC